MNKGITIENVVRAVILLLIVGSILWLLHRLSGVLLPFFFAWLIAYLLFPLVRFFQYRLHFRYRILGIISAFVVVGAILAIGFLLMVPPVVEECVRVKDLLVDYIENDRVMSTIPGMVRDFLRRNLTREQVGWLVTQDGFVNGVKAAVPQLWGIVTQGVNVLSGLLTLTMVLIYTLFILMDYERLCSGWPTLLPERYRGFCVRLLTDVEAGMNKYFRGQACVALCVGILFSIGFWIIDFPMAVGLGMFIGLLNMVPYLQLVGFVPTLLLAAVKSADTGDNFWVIMLGALCVFAVVQLIQDVILTPRIMGKVMGMNSAIILLSLSVWGSLLGMLGMIIALPMTTLLLTYYQRYVVRKPETQDDNMPEN